MWCLVSCVFRTLGSNVDAFKDTLEEFLNRLNESMSLRICGDFNIDLLNVSKYKTSDFLNALYSSGLYLLITEPSRITLNYATLIDNIFINVMENTVKSGLNIK